MNLVGVHVYKLKKDAALVIRLFVNRWCAKTKRQCK